MADRAKFVELLTALSSSDNDVRQQAEALYQQAKQSEPASLMVGMMSVLGGADVSEAVRIHGAVLMRQLVSRGPVKDFVFARVAQQHQVQIVGELLATFEREALPRLQHKVGEVIAKLAEYLCDPASRGSLALGVTPGWPALLPQVFRMADASCNASVASCEAALRLLKDLVATMKDEITGAKQALGGIIQGSLGHASSRIRSASLTLVCEIVSQSEKTAWTPLLQTAGVLVQVLRQFATAGETELLLEGLQAFTEVAGSEPDFFKGIVGDSMEPVSFLAELARSRAGVDPGVRSLALEWLVTYLEKKPKWLMKSVCKYLPLVLEVSMELMLEVEDGDAELQAWAERMDDEEGEDDEDDLYKVGEEAIDRIVEAVSIESSSQVLFQLIGRFAGQEAWQARHAALTAVRQTVEYVEERHHVDEMAKLLLQHVDHPHPRVRYIALLALSQLSEDHQPNFQEQWHETIMPVLLRKMDDAVERVAAMAMSAFVAFGDHIDIVAMLSYAPSLMQKLVAKLQVTQHRGVREESITAIATIAGVMEKDFSQYYDGIMPLLKQFVLTATGERENRLRGKAFECMSLLGLAVGKEKFLPDARDAIDVMMKTQLEADNIQREYIKEASERIAQCLKKDFAPFLPSLLPGILKGLRLEEDVGATLGAKGNEAFVQVTMGDGKLVEVRTQKFEEVQQCVQLVHCFCNELESAFYEYVPSTAEAMLPLLSTTDKSSMLCDEVRGVALQTWGLLIKVAREGSDERGLPKDVVRELLHTGFQRTFQVLDASEDAELLAETASGITECVKKAGPGILSSEVLVELIGKVFGLIDQSLARTNNASKDKTKDDDEDEDDDGGDGEEEQLRRNYEEVVGAVMKVAPSEFLPCLPQCAEKVRIWFGDGKNKVLALYFACDLIQHLGVQSQPTWAVVFPEVFNALGDDDADARTAAAFAINLAAPLASFAEAAPEAFRRLAKVVGKVRPKKRDKKGKGAYDNAVAALLSLAKEQGAQCPADIEPWSLVLSRLPLREDEEEAVKTHQKVAQLVLEQHQGLLGADGANLGVVLSFLAEIYHVDGLCNQETEANILSVFKQLPREVLQRLAPNFNEKQQKKVEKMLTV